MLKSLENLDLHFLKHKRDNADHILFYQLAQCKKLYQLPNHLQVHKQFRLQNLFSQLRPLVHQLRKYHAVQYFHLNHILYMFRIILDQTL